MAVKLRGTIHISVLDFEDETEIGIVEDNQAEYLATLDRLVTADLDEIVRRYFEGDFNDDDIRIVVDLNHEFVKEEQAA